MFLLFGYYEQCFCEHFYTGSVWTFSCICLRVGFLGQTLALCLTFWGNLFLFYMFTDINTVKASMCLQSSIFLGYILYNFVSIYYQLKNFFFASLTCRKWLVIFWLLLVNSEVEYLLKFTGSLHLFSWETLAYIFLSLKWYGREVRGEFRMGNTCTPMADSCWCMAKPIQYCKVTKKIQILVCR